MADRVGNIDLGKHLQVGTPAELLARPADSAVAGFLGNMPLLEGRVTERSGDRTRLTLPNEIEIPGTVDTDTVRLRIKPLP